MQLVDRIEKRRFVGREFLLWLWFESELFDATLHTKEHGPFGLWIEGNLVLSVGKEATRIRGAMPAESREAKEALLLGKLPESAGMHLSWRDADITFSIKAETLAVSRLSLPTLLDKPEDEPVQLLDDDRKPAPRKRRSESSEDSDETAERFYERMRLAQEFEELLEALYRDFLGLRLGEAWEELVLPAMGEWIAGEEVDEEDYVHGRTSALAKLRKR